MKRFITMIVAVCAFFAVSAQNSMVTLSHNGELSFFANLSAFEDAVDAAEDGDILYLSEGIFTSSNTEVTVDKRISIVGCGYKSQILFDIDVNMKNNPYVEGQSFNIDGVNLRTLSFNGKSTNSSDDTNRDNIGYVNISNSRIYKLQDAGLAGKDLKVSSCYIDKFIPYRVNKNNTIITNSKIVQLLDNNHDNSLPITLKNCNVWGSYYLPKTVISSIIYCSISQSGSPDSNFSAGSNNPSIINTLISNKSKLPETAIFQDCYFQDFEFDDNLDLTTDLSGYDGNVVGIHGGESPFSENPSVPTVDSANSTVEYDAASNKLKVNITVKAD